MKDEQYYRAMQKARWQCRWIILSAIVSFFLLPFLETLPFYDLNVGTLFGIDLDPVFWYFLTFFVLFGLLSFITWNKNRKIQKGKKTATGKRRKKFRGGKE